MDDPVRALSPRQRQCLELVAELKDTQQIAFELALSPNTVDSYIRDAVKALRAHNRRHAAQIVRDLAPPSHEKFGYDFSRGASALTGRAEPSTQSGGERAEQPGSIGSVRDTPTEYHAISGPGALSWSPFPGSPRRPGSIPPLRRLAMILLLIVALGAGVGIAVLTVAGAIVVTERSRP